MGGLFGGGEGMLASFLKLLGGGLAPLPPCSPLLPTPMVSIKDSIIANQKVTIRPLHLSLFQVNNSWKHHALTNAVAKQQNNTNFRAASNSLLNIPSLISNTCSHLNFVGGTGNKTEVPIWYQSYI